MKKILSLLLVLALSQGITHAAVAKIENYNADKLKEDIIKIYMLNGANVESNKLNDYTFTVNSRFATLWDNYLYKKNITIIQHGKDCLVNLEGFLSSSLYKNAKLLPYIEQKELNVLKTELQGGYTYGLSYFVKPVVQQNKKYMADGIDSNGIPFRINNSNNV